MLENQHISPLEILTYMHPSFASFGSPPPGASFSDTNDIMYWMPFLIKDEKPFRVG